MRAFRAQSWSPYAVGVGIGVLSWFAFATVQRGLGITTAFEHTAAMIASALDPTERIDNPYFAQNKPEIGWEWTLVVGVFLGSFLSSRLSGDRVHPVVPRLWRDRFGRSVPLRLTFAFLGGAVMMLGARLARGCTSGHGITGVLQLAVSSWIFISVAFGVAMVMAMAMYGRRGGRAVGDE